MFLYPKFRNRRILCAKIVRYVISHPLLLAFGLQDFALYTLFWTIQVCKVRQYVGVQETTIAFLLENIFFWQGLVSLQKFGRKCQISSLFNCVVSFFSVVLCYSAVDICKWSSFPLLSLSRVCCLHSPLACQAYCHSLKTLHCCRCESLSACHLSFVVRFLFVVFVFFQAQSATCSDELGPVP